MENCRWWDCRFPSTVSARNSPNARRRSAKTTRQSSGRKPMSKHVVAAAILAAALGGCALMPNEKLAPQPGADQVEMTKEQGGKFLAFVGPKLQHTEAFL